MKILITGIPGTGKTSIGKYLELEKGFMHFDVENTLRLYGDGGVRMIDDFVNKPGDKKIMTWGFIPVTDEPLVRYLQKLGFKMIWFDGNRDSARKEFLKRNDTPEELFDLQLGKIDRMNLEEFNPININTFDNEGNFLSREDIAELIFRNFNS